MIKILRSTVIVCHIRRQSFVPDIGYGEARYGKVWKRRYAIQAEGYGTVPVKPSDVALYN